MLISQQFFRLPNSTVSWYPFYSYFWTEREVLRKLTNKVSCWRTYTTTLANAWTCTLHPGYNIRALHSTSLCRLDFRRLPGSGLFGEWLRAHFPEKAAGNQAYSLCWNFVVVHILPCPSITCMSVNNHFATLYKGHCSLRTLTERCFTGCQVDWLHYLSPAFL